MNIAMISAGALILAALLVGLSASIARTIGWREVLAAWAFSLTVTSAIAAGVVLIVLGAIGQQL